MGEFDSGTYSLPIAFPTKDLFTCETVCFSTIDVVLDLSPSGALAGTGVTHACSPLFEDSINHWRLLPDA